MFDIGPQPRQETAIFNHSFISKPPQDEISHTDAWIQRMKLGTVIHKTGYGFSYSFIAKSKTMDPTK